MYREGDSFGFLIDLDFAAFLAVGGNPNPPDTDDQAEGVSYSLARAFVAIDQLPLTKDAPPSVHLYRHDLESFFWSLLWLLTEQAHDEVSSNLMSWKLTSPLSLYHDKLAFLEPRFSTVWCRRVTQVLWGTNNEQRTQMQSFLIGLVQMFREGYDLLKNDPETDYDSAGGQITYTGLFNTLTTVLDMNTIPT